MFEELGLGDLLFTADDKGSQLPDPNEVTYWQLRKDRVFAIDYEIEDDYKCIELAKLIYQLNLAEKDIPEDELKPITLLIFSYGGSLDQSQALCDIMEVSRIPIITVCLGVAMSAGLLIFLAGRRRYAFRQCSLLVHQGTIALSGSASEVSEAQKNYKRQLDQMKKYILSHTEISEKLFSKNKTKDWYIDADEAASLGICKIVSSFSEIV